MRGDPLTSPWVWTCADYLGRKLSFSMAFNNSTHALGNTTVTRDVGCLWGTLMIGDPNGSVKTFAVAEGTSTVRQQQLNNNGLNTIDDVLALNITAGP